MILIERRLGGPQGHAGRGSKEKHSQPPSGIDLDPPARSLVAILSELSQLPKYV
jgi:hypothetical protein